MALQRFDSSYDKTYMKNFFCENVLSFLVAILCNVKKKKKKIKVKQNEFYKRVII